MQNSPHHQKEHIILFIVCMALFVIAISAGIQHPVIANILYEVAVWLTFIQAFFPDLTKDVLPLILSALLDSVSLLKTPQGRRRAFSLMTIISIILLITLFLPFISPLHFVTPAYSSPLCNPTKADASCLIDISGGDTAGLSNKVSAFDAHRVDGKLKYKAVQAYDAGNKQEAEQLLQRAIAADPTDGEARIDLENLTVPDSDPTWSIIVGTDIVSDSTQWEATIQGAFTAQHHFNSRKDLPNNLKVVLLLASFGGNQATKVIGFIEQALEDDNHIIGMVGWPSNVVSDGEVQKLQQENLPIILSTTESENMAGSYQFAFLIAATSKQQGAIGAKFAMQDLHSQNVVVVMDNNDTYSSNLGTMFSQTFHAIHTPTTLLYTTGDIAEMPKLLKRALSYHPDLIYFAGDANDINAFLSNPTAFATDPKVNILTGDAVYDLPSYPKGALNRLYYTTSAFEDMYRYNNFVQPHIFCEYTGLFTQTTVGETCDQSKTYWRDRASSDTILAMDAMALLIQAIKLVGFQSSLTPKIVEQALMSLIIPEPTTFQGVSGCIKLGPDRKPSDDKNVVVLKVDNAKDTHIVYRQGCLIASTPIMSLYEKNSH